MSQHVAEMHVGPQLVPTQQRGGEGVGFFRLAALRAVTFVG